MDEHNGERFDYLLQELDGARSVFFGLMTLALAMGGFVFVSIQIQSLALSLYTGGGALVFLWLGMRYPAYEATIKAKIKEYLKQPDKYDLDQALREVWDVERLPLRFGVHKRSGQT